MKLELPSANESRCLIVSLVFLVFVCVIGFLVRINDATHGWLGRRFNSVLDWLCERQRRCKNAIDP